MKKTRPTFIDLLDRYNELKRQTAELYAEMEQLEQMGKDTWDLTLEYIRASVTMKAIGNQLADISMELSWAE